MSKLKDIFQKLDNDQERWELVAGNTDKFSIILDNDETYANLDGEWLKFDGSIGDMSGIFDLLSTLGIEADYC